MRHPHLVPALLEVPLCGGSLDWVHVPVYGWVPCAECIRIRDLLYKLRLLLWENSNPLAGAVQKGRRWDWLRKAKPLKKPRRKKR